MFVIPMVCMAASLVATAGEGGEHDRDPPDRNAFGVRAVFAVHLLEERTSGVAGVDAPERDRLGGFVLSYDRVLVHDLLALSFAKPFLFGSGRFDSPFDTSLRVMRRWGDAEPFVAAGATFNIRVFDAEREEIEGRPNALSLGIVGAGGLAYWLGEATALEAEVGFAHIVAGPVVDNEISGSVGLAFAF